MLNFIINYFDLQGYIDGTEKFNLYEFFGMDTLNKSSQIFIYSILIFTLFIVTLCYTVTKL